MSGDKRSGLQFLAVACLILCALFILFSVPFFWTQIRVLRTWPTTQAQVLRSEVVTQPAPAHEQLYAARLELLYTIEGRPITVELTSFQSRNYEETQRRAAEFAVGSRHPLLYDPRNPDQARIGAGWNTRFFAVPLLLLGMGTVFAAIAAAFFLAAA